MSLVCRSSAKAIETPATDLLNPRPERNGLVLKRCDDAPAAVQPSPPSPPPSPVFKTQAGGGVTLKRRLAVPEVRYRWSQGFRKRGAEHGGRYMKVTLVRVELQFAREFERLPDEMLFRYEPSIML